MNRNTFHNGILLKWILSFDTSSRLYKNNTLTPSVADWLVGFYAKATLKKFQTVTGTSLLPKDSV